LTQSGKHKLIQNALTAKKVSTSWRRVASVLADALAALDFQDIESDVEPYFSAVSLAEKIKADKLDEVLLIIGDG